ncbi:hypothetical protein SJA_C1-09780 [Sphingobium indicum UT26S]|uniref:Uncharacterized protein n=1 Tax=Sphingobium indicum (strain DSM 16413 / CCM 7287 / MTCC 6362 / UT26 / NBRC 101211 / UT26S) TaxID=452662 RepID=D4YZN0_SPHIU|nr:hypothetical protein SJA_C1-09780 [Sphingobium indicum UT26S]
MEHRLWMRKDTQQGQASGRKRGWPAAGVQRRPVPMPTPAFQNHRRHEFGANLPAGSRNGSADDRANMLHRATRVGEDMIGSLGVALPGTGCRA